MTDPMQLLGDANDVTHTSAVLVLNTLVEEGRLLEERADYLKQKFKELHNRVLVVYKRDNFLLKRARQLRKELDAEKERVMARGDIAQEDDAEIQRLKKVLLDAENELSDVQERESILQVEALEYDRKKHTLLLEREDAVAAEETRLRPRVEALQAEIAAMGKEIEEMAVQYQDAVARRDAILAQEAECKEHLANWNATMAEASRQLANVENAPERALRQAEPVLKSLEAAQEDLRALEEKIAAQDAMISKLELQNTSRSTDYAQAKAALQKLRNQVESKRTTLATLNTSLEIELETRQGYQQRIAELEQLIKSSHVAHGTELANAERVRREKEHAATEDTDVNRSMNKTIKDQQEIREQIAIVNKDIEKLRAVRKRNAQRIEEGRSLLEKETRAFLKEQSREKDFIQKADAVGTDIASAKREIAGRTAEEEVRRRETTALVLRRQDLNRDCAREASRVTMGKDELHMKEMYLAEARKRRDDLEQRLHALTELFQNVKRERSHKAAQIQAITQKITEMAEKKTILENELAVLCRESSLKETELVKKRRQVQDLRQICKNLRMEKNRQHKALDHVVDVERNKRSQVRRANVQIASLEDDMENAKHSYDDVIESRNYAGIQLLDRNDELCVLYERVHAQERAIREGVQMTNARNEEIRALTIQLADLRREMDVMQRSIPKVREMEAELARLTEEIDDERWKIEILENDLTNPKNPHRWRVIQRTLSGRGEVSVIVSNSDGGNGGNGEASARAGHSSLTPVSLTVGRSSGVQGPSDDFVELQQRCQVLEARVQALNERIREKDLILEEVAELSSRLTEQARGGREFTLALAQQVNGYQSNIRAKSRQMMATVSELSVFQATAIQLQQDVQRLEGLLEEAERRVSQGEAPFAEAETRYMREEESRRRYAAMLRRRQEEIAEANAAASALVTTAEQRPNAYIPENELGVPKPFGALAPFKPGPAPSQQSARYYRGQQRNVEVATGLASLVVDRVPNPKVRSLAVNESFSMSR